MKRLATLFVLVGLVFQVSGQNDSYQINGIVIDSISNEPVAYASVGLINSMSGTVTNLNGEFAFNVSVETTADSIGISSVGYKVKSLAIDDLIPNEPITIKLQPSEKLLDDVVITEKLNADEIIQLAVDNMVDNHGDLPVSMEVFYRERQLIEHEYVSLVEASMTVYDEFNVNKRNSPLRTKIRVDQLRRSLQYDHPYNDWWHKENLMMHAWNVNPIPYSLKRMKKRLDKGYFKRLSSSTVQGQETFVVTTISDGFWESIYYIQRKTYAVVRVEEVYDEQIDGPKTWQLENDSIPITIHFKQRKAVVDFKKVNGKYFPSFITFDANHDYYHEDKRLANFRIVQDILINSLNYENPEVVARSESARRYSSLRDEEYAYDEEFWKNYNVIKETPLETQLIKDLESKISLENQFKSPTVFH